MLRTVLKKGLEAKLHKNSSCKATYHPSKNLSKLEEPDMEDTDGGVRTNSKVKYFLLSPSHRRAKAGRPARISVPLQDVAWRTSWERRMIETGGGNVSGKSVQAVWQDDEDCYQTLTILSNITHSFAQLSGFKYFFMYH